MCVLRAAEIDDLGAVGRGAVGGASPHPLRGQLHPGGPRPFDHRRSMIHWPPRDGREAATTLGAPAPGTNRHVAGAAEREHHGGRGPWLAWRCGAQPGVTETSPASQSNFCSPIHHVRERPRGGRGPVRVRRGVRRVLGRPRRVLPGRHRVGTRSTKQVPYSSDPTAISPGDTATRSGTTPRPSGGSRMPSRPSSATRRETHLTRRPTTADTRAAPVAACHSKARSPDPPWCGRRRTCAVPGPIYPARGVVTRRL